MLLDLLKGGIENITPERIIELGLYIIVILISLSTHELFHGYVAYRCGDATARNFGRLTLNPLAHLDPLGTIMMLCFGFGYAKPVPINTRNFNNFKRDLCFVSLAGPLSNVVLSFIGVLLHIISIMLGLKLFGFEMPLPMSYWVQFCSYFAILNANLAVFNLLPIPPLDGSRIVSVLLPEKAAYFYLKYERYIMIAVFALLYIGVLDGIISFLSGHLLDGIVTAVDFILTPVRKILLGV